MDLSNIPIAGWLVIAFIAVLVFVLLLLILRKGVRLGVGDKKIIVGDVEKSIDSKLSAFKGEIEQREKNRQKDEELRKNLFRIASDIDEKTKADNRRVIRKLTPAIQDIFKPYGHCEFTTTSAVEIIRDELTERVDYNCIKERLSISERSGYIADIMHHIKLGNEIPHRTCGKTLHKQVCLRQTCSIKSDRTSDFMHCAGRAVQLYITEFCERNTAPKAGSFKFCTRMCRKVLDSRFCGAKPVLQTEHKVPFANKLQAENSHKVSFFVRRVWRCFYGFASLRFCLKLDRQNRHKDIPLIFRAGRALKFYALRRTRGTTLYNGVLRAEHRT